MTTQNALIVGASRGLGLEFVRQYRAAGWAVTGTARADDGLQRIQALGARALRVDVASAAGAAALAWPLDGEHFDVVVINAGVYGPRHSGLEAPTQDEFDAVMHTNVLGAMRVLSQVLDVLAPGAKVAVISSRMGSIGLRTASGGWLYRASKAALNSVLKDTAILLSAKARCVAFHPGWVRTDMGGTGADIDATESVAGMRQVLADLTAESSGSFINYDGTPLQW
jgi:NAD(P)-dependent dehydrogenase (short-subunit alcohol dehydrogenase family)